MSIGSRVKVIIDRPVGSKHPKYPDMVYPINYGYVEGVIAGDGEEQDCYIMGEAKPLDVYEGNVIAIIKRMNDVEEKWVVSNKRFTLEEIKEATFFTEQYFEIEIMMS